MFKIEQENVSDGVLLKVDMTGESDNATMVAELDKQSLPFGKVAYINGRCSVPLAYVLAHKLLHNFANVAVFDPKMGGYIVVSNHGGIHRVGEVIQN